MCSSEPLRTSPTRPRTVLVRRAGWPDLSEYAVHLTKASAEGDAYPTCGGSSNQPSFSQGSEASGPLDGSTRSTTFSDAYVFSEIPLHLLQRLVERRSSHLRVPIVFSRASLSASQERRTGGTKRTRMVLTTKTRSRTICCPGMRLRRIAMPIIATR